MFGDVGHGLMLLLSAIVIILFEGKLPHSTWLQIVCDVIIFHHHLISLVLVISAYLILSSSHHLISLVLLSSHLSCFVYLISSFSKGRFSRQSKDELGQFGTVFRARYLLLLMV
jgi:vacuolar-type H+-ATPase subunit I/STV1